MIRDRFPTCFCQLLLPQSMSAPPPPPDLDDVLKPAVPVTTTASAHESGSKRTSFFSNVALKKVDKSQIKDFSGPLISAMTGIGNKKKHDGQVRSGLLSCSSVCVGACGCVHVCVS